MAAVNRGEGPDVMLAQNPAIDQRVLPARGHAEGISALLGSV